MQLKHKRVLVTGADGFIGSHLTEHLVHLGADVRAFVYYNSNNSWGWLDDSDEHVRKSIKVVAGDIRDPFGVKEAMRDCDVVLHLAALIAIPYSYHSPATYVETNVNGTLNVVQAARDLGIEKVVHTSTSEVYGTARFVPITEEHPLQGQSPYSATKIGADQIAQSYFLSFDTPVATIRPFNTYGPRQSARAVIPTIISQIAAGAKEVRLGATHPTRDFNFVRDTVRGFVAIAESEKTVGEVINVSSNYEISIGETAELIAERMGRDVSFVADDNRLRPSNSEVERLWGANDKARRLTGWVPQYADREGFARGLSETIDWFSDPSNLRRYKTGIYNI
ncbi:SDR family NAD(P)-dependent oxidoreductase [Sphingomonas lacunae]|uniref:SDR family NAD(P)-dependent oxidoreductase n=1 Tax=Sphingomonas lacunae TaxID=2698828 RepID=A0A6M4B099_9SPHN|nr:NAD-dependent 4,6-dehydratase LegB [Sphingomonas lacunae]QJQ32761.1 SDR family NAD(P)-dependent oxidoreductase [Sphingomonas lacunae]